MELHQMDMTRAHAEAVVAAGKTHADERGEPMCFAVVDAAGNLVSFARQDGASLIAADVAVGKAYTAAAMRMPTSALSAVVQPGAPLFGVLAACGSRALVPIAGGHPIGEPAIGAVGISGGTPAADGEIAAAISQTGGAS